MNEKESMTVLNPKYKNTALDILNINSDINSLYKLNSPFQITYEYCSGPDSKDYINIVSLSPNGNSYSQESIDFHNYIFHNKSPHIHDYYEFLIVLDGSLSQQIEGKEYLYPAGSCCLINRNLCHKEIFHQTAQVLFLGLSVDFILDLLNTKPAYFDHEEEIKNTLFYNFIFNDLKNPGQKAYLDFIPSFQNNVSCENLRQYTEKLLETMLFPKFGSTYMVNGFLSSVLQYISSPENYHCTCMELSNNSDYLLFARVEHLLEKNDGRITRAELSDKLNYSSDYLNRIVNKYTGMSLHEYGMRFCMKKAAYYLSHTDESITSIMSKLSFTNRTYFYKLFKNQYGMTPKAFRENRCHT